MADLIPPNIPEAKPPTAPNIAPIIIRIILVCIVKAKKANNQLYRLQCWVIVFRH
nr:MAG TPA: hypothetical protein [Caudoviricetes sp.]